jgi:putative ABC transport system permease protein
MSLIGYFLRTALNNLRRGGRRMLVALLCIAFGVMSLVAMTLMSQSLERVLVMDARYQIGADITMDRQTEDYILPEHEEMLRSLHQAEKIQRYTLLAYSDSLTFHQVNSGELYFPTAGFGVDVQKYPLAGPLTIENVGKHGLADLLSSPGDVLITRDIALDQGLGVGDTLVLSDLRVGVPVTGHIRGIVKDTPNHQGSKVYYNLATAEMLANGGRILNTALLLANDPPGLIPDLQTSGWRPFLATQLAQSDRQVQGMFELTLNGAGILGLLVGGIGIANTMQVMLRRRRKEVAVWKSLGYQSGALQVFFAIEAFLVGAAGSLLGAGLGVLISSGLVNLFSRTSTVLIELVISPAPILMGIAVGIITTMIFSMFAIVLTSQVQPLALLRNEALATASLSWIQIIVLFLLLSAPMAAMTTWVMGSLGKGIGVLAVALIGLVVLGSAMFALLWVVARVLPLRRLPLMNMARNNVCRRGRSQVFAMVALFIGVVTLSLSFVVTHGAQHAMDGKSVRLEGTNMKIVAPLNQEDAIAQAIAGQNISLPLPGYQATVQKIQIQGRPDISLSPKLFSPSDLSEYALQGAAWNAQRQGVYVYKSAEIPSGSQVVLTLWDGSQRTYPVVGTYSFDPNTYTPLINTGVLMPGELLKQTAHPEAVSFSIHAPDDQVQAVSAALGKALPQATVINLVAYASRMVRQYQNLFIFAVSMAGLALLAGVLLIANSVSVAMLERHYEMGVLKAMGYSRGQVLMPLMVEYGLVGCVAIGAGLAIVKLFLWGLGMAEPLMSHLLVMPFSAAAWIGCTCLGLILATVFLTTWRPTQVSPAVVLNDRV